MLPRPFSDFANPQSNLSPVPPRAFWAGRLLPGERKCGYGLN